MTVHEMIGSLEIALIAALAKFGAGMNEDEVSAFRLGFLAGTRHGLDAARTEIMREIANERKEKA